ncbi:hypothetical protein CPC08DRAFT_717801 [Agrocybe pediades]|nr:hypothetical protein CPC08DRAFT_717801 [Agrocybe pediades]
MSLIAGANKGTASSREELQRAWTFCGESGRPTVRKSIHTQNQDNGTHLLIVPSSGPPFIDNAGPIADDAPFQTTAALAEGTAGWKTLRVRETGHWSGNPHLPFNIWSNGTGH